MKSERGVAEPTHELIPEHGDSYGADAGELAAGYGLKPDPWQQHVLDGFLALNGEGWAASRCGIAVPRQNGKNAILEAVELFKMAILGRKILHTAHEVKTARKAFTRLCSFFEDARHHPEMAELVQSIRRTNGQEAILLTNGGSVEFIARSKGSGRGFTVDDLVCDEAQHLTDEEQEALLPTISAAPSGDPQTILTGTPPLSMAEGGAFRRFRTAGISGDDPGLCWFEWSVDGDVDVRDRGLWARANPAFGIRLHEKTIADEAEAMSPDGFARERLGRWPTGGEGAAIDAAAWDACAVDEAPEGTISFGVDMPPDRSSLAIGGCRKTKDGRFHVELVRFEPSSQGTAWAVDWLAERWPRTAAVVIDRQSPAMVLLPELLARHVRVTVTGGPEIGAACGRVVDLLTQNTVEPVFTHLRGQKPLEMAVAGATTRPVGQAGQFAWNRRATDIDISPLVAVTLALHGAATSKRHPGRKARLL